MFKKMVVDLVQGIHANTRAIQAQTDAIAFTNSQLIEIERTIDVGMATIVKAKLALMTGTERKRFDESTKPLVVHTPMKNPPCPPEQHSR